MTRMSRSTAPISRSADDWSNSHACCRRISSCFSAPRCTPPYPLLCALLCSFALDAFALDNLGCDTFTLTCRTPLAPVRSRCARSICTSFALSHGACSGSRASMRGVAAAAHATGTASSTNSHCQPSMPQKPSSLSTGSATTPPTTLAICAASTALRRPEEETEAAEAAKRGDLRGERTQSRKERRGDTPEEEHARERARSTELARQPNRWELRCHEACPVLSAAEAEAWNHRQRGVAECAREHRDEQHDGEKPGYSMCAHLAAQSSVIRLYNPLIEWRERCLGVSVPINFVRLNAYIHLCELRRRRHRRSRHGHRHVVISLLQSPEVTLLQPARAASKKTAMQQIDGRIYTAAATAGVGN
eukprot:6183182-Pleurochrysis_carterae.AAC.2